MRMRLAAAVLTGALGFVACSLGSLDGFSGGDASDGGTSSGDGTVLADVETKPNDGGSDAADASGPCPPDAALCETFDELNPLSTWATETSGGTVAVRQEQSTSAPSSFHADIANAVGVARNAYVTRTLTNGSVAHARLSYSLYIDKRPTTNAGIEANIVRFTTTDGQFNDFYLEILNGSANYREQHKNVDGGYLGGASVPLGTSIPSATWVRVSLEVVLAGSKTMAVSIDGTQIGQASLTLNGAGSATVTAGITFTREADDAKLYVDDVVFEILP